MLTSQKRTPHSLSSQGEVTTKRNQLHSLFLLQLRYWNKTNLQSFQQFWKHRLNHQEKTSHTRQVQIGLICIDLLHLPQPALLHGQSSATANPEFLTRTYASRRGVELIHLLWLLFRQVPFITFRFTEKRSITINSPSNTLHVSSLKKEICNENTLFDIFSEHGEI